MMRKLNSQTDKINTELDVHKKLAELKKQSKDRSKSAGKGDKTGMSQANTTRLMRMYEKRSKDGEFST